MERKGKNRGKTRRTGIFSEGKGVQRGGGEFIGEDQDPRPCLNRITPRERVGGRNTRRMRGQGPLEETAAQSPGEDAVGGGTK